MRRLLMIREVARQLGLGRTTTYALIAAGRLRAVHIGRSVRVDSAEVERFIDWLATQNGAAA